MRLQLSLLLSERRLSGEELRSQLLLGTTSPRSPSPSLLQADQPNCLSALTASPTQSYVLSPSNVSDVLRMVTFSRALGSTAQGRAGGEAGVLSESGAHGANTAEPQAVGSLRTTAPVGAVLVQPWF